jgi:hypothetical protein
LGISPLIKLLVAPMLLVGGAGGMAPFVALPAIAAEQCGTWHAASQDDEGGPVLAATVCATGDDVSPGLTVQCFEKVNIRYDLGTKEPIVLQPRTTGRFTFTSGTTVVTEKFQYEDMDGMFAGYVPKTDPLLALFKSGSEVTVTDAAGKFKPHDFSLSGSTGAIGKVLAQCGKAPASNDD